MTDVNSAYNVTAEELRQIIEQYEEQDSEKKTVSERQKEILTEAKNRGYDTKIIRKIVTLRKKSKEAIEEENAILDVYMSALGME